MMMMVMVIGQEGERESNARSLYTLTPDHPPLAVPILLLLLLLLFLFLFLFLIPNY